jgi:S-formylglutathione hydrolase FrmB
MALFRGVLRSQVLAMDTAITVILPFDRPPEHFTAPCKTLYLLHGLGDNSDAWVRYTAIERYARDEGLAVILPEVQRSFYLNMHYGLPYFTYVAEELPALCEQMFPLSPRREDRYVAGLSMGGYGAIKCGLARPDFYAGCASFSGAMDIHDVVDTFLEKENNKVQMQAAIGMDLTVEEGDDLFALAAKVAALQKENQPRIFITCGEQDFLLAANRRFRDHLQALPLAYTYREWPGDHEWGFWDTSVKQALDFFFHP